MKGNRYKTTMCKHFEQMGQCPLGAKCHFAHGRTELRNVNDPLPPGVPVMNPAPKPVLATANPTGNTNYRTSKCKYYDQGKCKFGSNCSFAHGEVEPKPFANSYPSPQGGSNGMHNTMNHNNDRSIENEVAYHQIQFLASQMEDFHANDKEILIQIKQANDLNKSNHVQDAASILYSIMNRSNKTKQETDNYAMFVCKIQEHGTTMYQQLQSQQNAPQGNSNTMGYNSGGNFGSYKQDFGSHTYSYQDKENSYNGQGGNYGMNSGGHHYGMYSGGFGSH